LRQAAAAATGVLEHQHVALAMLGPQRMGAEVALLTVIMGNDLLPGRYGFGQHLVGIHRALLSRIANIIFGDDWQEVGLVGSME
jgi:hypothetical protein